MTREPRVQRVLQVHTRYRQLGGEDQVVEAERQLLERAGVSVRQEIFDNADLRESRSIMGDLRIAASTVSSRAAERRVRAALRDHDAQVMHVHNTFAAASPSVYGAASRLGVPVVQTLHNYRLVCPAGTTFRDGRACTDCVGRVTPWPAVVHACYRDSRAQSAVAAATLAVHRGLGTFARRIGAYVALTAFQRELLIAGGLPGSRIRVIPNFLARDPGVGDGPRMGVVFAGRLAPEKGLGTLLAAAALQPGLVRIAGGGPLGPDVERAAAADHIDALGALDHGAVLREIQRSAALVLPSIWFEGFPIAVLEAYATGTPVIASRIGSLAEIVEDGVTGLLVAPGDADDLAQRLGWAGDHPEEMRRMGATARLRYEARYTGGVHLRALLDVYEAVGLAAGRGAEA